MDWKRVVLNKFVASHQRVIATTLRDMQDENECYAAIGVLEAAHHGSTSLPADIRYKCYTSEEVKRHFGTETTGCRYCLDQLRHVRSTPSMDRKQVVIGVYFEEDGDLITFVTQINCIRSEDQAELDE